ncbi:MAG: acyl-CoA thioester hydrolase/BAAT C-terminal domain-containing protein, partial [Acidobacteriota bacterium]
SALRGDLETGPYAVGFRVLYRMDNSRSYFPQSAIDRGASRGRPIRIMVWYPARKMRAALPMRFSDYVMVEPTDSRFAAWNKTRQARDLQTTRNQFAQPDSAPLVDKLMSARVAAFLNAPTAKGSFPLLMHSVGLNDHQAASTVLWEYLASYGYVIATVPQLGADLLKPRLAFTAADIRVQCEDLQFAMAEMFSFPNVDAGRVALMGHSAGAVVAFLIAEKNKNVDAVVSLDGSINTEDGRAVLDAAGFDASRFRASLLNIYRANDTHALDFKVNSLRYADRYNIAVDPQITHFDFGNWPMYSIFTDVEDPRGKSFRSSQVARQFHLNMCRRVLAFLEDTFKAARIDDSIKEKLPFQEGMKFSFQEGIKIPRADDLAEMLISGEAEKARKLFESARARYPQEAIIEETSFNNLAGQLLQLKKTAEAIAVFQLNVEAHPSSPAAHLGLAEAYRQGGQKEAAILEYEKAIRAADEGENAKSPSMERIRQSAVKRLSELKPPTDGRKLF